MPDEKPYLVPDARSAQIHPKLKEPPKPRPQSFQPPVPPSAEQVVADKHAATRTTTTAHHSGYHVSSSSAGRSSRDHKHHKDIVIHVFDENRNAKRDFICKRHLLLREMKYFTAYLLPDAAGLNGSGSASTGTASDRVEIDVHCDIEVFEWLMGYITRQRPPLEPRTAISILISSHFLQMSALEDACLKYVHDHLSEVVKVPIDMTCIQQNLITKLARLFTLEELSKVSDPRNKILSQLYFIKLSDLLTVPPSQTTNTKPLTPVSVLRCCTLCQKVYAREQEPYLRCDRARVEVDFNGEINALHRRNEKFDPNDYIASLRLTCASWKEVFWRVWGITNHMRCTTCNTVFACADFVGCRRHVSSPIFEEDGGGVAKGVYPCCGDAEWKFRPLGMKKGCRLFNHTPHPANADVYATFRAHMDLIMWPHSTDLGREVRVEAGVSKDGGDDESRVFGLWSPDMYGRLPQPSTTRVTAQPSRPTSVGSRPGSAPAKIGYGTALRKPQHVQRDDDLTRMLELSKLVLRLRDVNEAD
ncbi:hypothetical protein HK104_006501 [Borealophlyctis nickersoniae]|nr:hypothetical protein HK104_006501 [Borealophlyctis nickersoniae]